MPFPQPGIFALGTPAHSYLEFDLVATDGAGQGPTTARISEALAAAARLGAMASTMGGVNVVVGFRPELLAAARQSLVPAALTGFAQPVVGDDGFTMPATQHDIAVWVAGGANDVVFDAATDTTRALAAYATLAEETTGWGYHRDLDLTGFTDGTENPELSSAPSLVLVPEGEPGAAGSVLLLQRWPHDAAAWTALGDADQAQVIGRTKDTNEELSPRPETSHVARTDQETFGHILRRNTAFGSVREHGTIFVGFAAGQAPLADMLASMAGTQGRPRDALTRFSHPETGAYYFVPSLDTLIDLAGPVAD